MRLSPRSQALPGLTSGPPILIDVEMVDAGVEWARAEFACSGREINMIGRDDVLSLIRAAFEGRYQLAVSDELGSLTELMR
jgi:precorrin isomerase